MWGCRVPVHPATSTLWGLLSQPYLPWWLRLTGLLVWGFFVVHQVTLFFYLLLALFEKFRDDARTGCRGVQGGVGGGDDVFC